MTNQNENQNKKEFKFNKLIPCKDISLGIYKDSLDYCLSDDDILNIAITGSYGAGKSSILETYKRVDEDKDKNEDKDKDKNKDKKRKYIHISLARFENINENVSKEDDNSIENKEEITLEGKILNQLIYQIPPNNIPLTKFKITKDKNEQEILYKSILFMIFIFLYVYLFNPGLMKNLTINTYIDFFEFENLYISNISTVLIFIIFMFILFYGIYNVIYLQNNSFIFKKINIGGNEIEILEDNKDSYFDKYLNEVIYVFKHSQADVIVFEDIDRYNTNKIFEKLREINYLINNHIDEKENKKKKIKFLYLIKDDIFVNKDRTKFFDFIIPIVPTICSYNSYDKLLECLKENNSDQGLDSYFLKDISLYIDDMRLLKNICNEYLIYSNKINEDFNKNENLFSIIVYKNLFPNDFAELLLNRGYVYSLMNSKLGLIKNQKDTIEKKIDELEKRIKNAEEENLENINELIALFYQEGDINQKLFYNENIDLRGGKSRVKLIKEIIKESSGLSFYINNTYGNKPYEIIKKIYEEEEFIRRKDYIENKSNSKIKNINIEIKKLKIELGKLECSMISQLLNKNNKEYLFELKYIDENSLYIESKDICLNNIKNNHYYPLIKYIVRKGYLNEDYADYMNYFYGEYICKSDMKFIKSVVNEESLGFNHEIKDGTKIIKALNPSYFNNEEILNFDLLTYLLKADKYENLLKSMMELIIEKSIFNFLFGYLEKEIENKKFIEMLFNVFKDIFDNISIDENIEKSKKREFLLESLYLLDEKYFENRDKEDSIIKFIEENNDFLDFDTEEINDFKIGRMINKFKLMNIKLRYINYDGINKVLLGKIYHNNMYEINMELIKIMLREFYNIEMNNIAVEKLTTTIFRDKESSVYEYISENIDEYMKKYINYLNEDMVIEDDKIIVVDILNNKNILLENKYNYICKLETKLDFIKDISPIDYEKTNYLWDKLITKNLLEYNMENIIAYYFYCNKNIDENLVDFINKSENEINFDYNKLVNDYTYDEVDNLLDHLVKSINIKNEKYKNLISLFNLYYPKFKFENITKEKMNILIELKKIKMNKDHLELLREKYKDNINYFINNYIQKYVELVEENTNLFDFEELLKILDDENISNDLKIRLLEQTNKTINIENKNYNIEIENYIIKNNFNEDELNYIIKNYDKYEEDKSIIQIKIKDNFNDVISNNYINDSELLLKVFADKFLDENKILKLISVNMNLLDENDILKLIALSVDVLNEEEIKNLFNEISKLSENKTFRDLYNLFESNKQQKLKINEDVKVILDFLCKKKYISSYKQENNIYRVHPKRKNN